MQRTQISLTAADRHALDEAAARTGKSLSALIRESVENSYGVGRSVEEDLATMRSAFGSWERDSGTEGAEWVDRLRSGSRLRSNES